MKVFELGEPGVFLSIKTATPEVRVDQLIQEQSKIKMLKIQSGVNVDSGEAVKYQLEKNISRHSEKIGVFISHAEIPIREGNFRLFDEILELKQYFSNIRFIFLSEIDITHPLVSQKFTNSRIFSSVHYYPLYPKTDMNAFAGHMAKEWHTNFDKKLVNSISEACGGYMWLVKEALRAAKLQNETDIDALIDSESMQFKLEQIYISLQESERTVLSRIITKEQKAPTLEEKHSMRYLTKVGLIQNNKITVPVLEDYIEAHLPKANVRIYKNHILVNQVVVDSAFSRKQQRALKYLINKSGEICTRDEVAKAIWPVNTDDYYTDWALDRIIARLRDNLDKIGLSKNIVQTVRGQGYKLDPTQRP